MKAIKGYRYTQKDVKMKNQNRVRRLNIPILIMLFFAVPVISLSAADPTSDASAFLQKGINSIQSEDYQQAIKDFDKAIELNPNLAEAYNNRGLVYGKLGNLQQAIKDFDKAIELNPNYAEAYYSRGIAFGKLGNLQQEIKDYDKAIELNPDLAQAYYNRGNAHMNLDNLQQATKDLKTAALLGLKEAQYFLVSQEIEW
jgi:tetratricopeptide (TPR) repeat protein